MFMRTCTPATRHGTAALTALRDVSPPQKVYSKLCAAKRPLAAMAAAAEPGPGTLAALEAHRERSWAFFRSIGSPSLHVAPMVDQSELAFRMLCRKNGATCAYTPMLHSRIFGETEKYREEQFTTCEGDRPLFVQFCGNDADTVLRAARHVEDQVDAVDLNFGCPQRIAKKGHYGAFLMDNLDHVEKMVTSIAAGLKVPLTAKIRIFPELERTLAYARMLERSGVQLLGVHGRTREMKEAKAHKADWGAIKAVKEAIGIPVIANGNILTLADAHRCMEYTGADGVMSAEPLLANAALFSDKPESEQPWADRQGVRGCVLLQQYLDLVDEYETPIRIQRAHMHRFLGDWLQEHTDLRDNITRANFPTTAQMRPLIEELMERIRAAGRDQPVPKLSERKLLQLKRKAEAEVVEQRKREQQQETQQLHDLVQPPLETVVQERAAAEVC